SVRSRNGSRDAEQLGRVWVPAEFDGPFPTPSWRQHAPAGIDAAFGQVGRVRGTSVWFNTQRLAVCRGEQHRLAEVRRGPNLPRPAEVAVAQFRPPHQTAGRDMGLAKVAIQRVERDTVHEAELVPV